MSIQVHTSSSPYASEGRYRPRLIATQKSLPHFCKPAPHSNVLLLSRPALPIPPTSPSTPRLAHPRSHAPFSAESLQSIYPQMVMLIGRGLADPSEAVCMTAVKVWAHVCGASACVPPIPSAGRSACSDVDVQPEAQT
eukprot:352724-Chlamydomonas_euryale.AAC.7